MRKPRLSAKLTSLKYTIDKGTSDFIRCDVIYPGNENPLNSIREVIWTLNEQQIESFKNIRVAKNELAIENASDLNNGVLKCKLVDINNETAESQAIIEITDRDASRGKPKIKITSNK